MRRGGLAAWSIRHPVSTLMLTLTAVVLGVFALGRLSIDLLPHIIYPQVRVRVIDPGVAAAIMEDRVTRQLEEQMAITEDAVGIESTTSEGQSYVLLDFDYGKDIDLALRDASTRLDRAKRFLPTTIDPPMIWKSDPSQIPVMEFLVTSTLLDLVELRTWTDDHLAKQFLNLPGVAAAEVGGGLVREIQILPDQRRLAGLGLSVNDVINAVRRGNEDAPGGRLRMGGQEYASRTAGRLTNVAAIAALPVRLPSGESIPLAEIASVSDSHEEERIRARFNGTPGIKLAIQKQPNANTVEVTEHVKARLAWLRANEVIPQGIQLNEISDQSIYIRQSLSNATLAALSGAVLAMIVVYLFLGSFRGTLIIGTAIPISIIVTFVIMALGGLTLNIMTLGGLALGIGMLVDNTIIMLENIARHRREKESANREAAHVEDPLSVPMRAAAEVTSPIIASTTTSLAAVVPFLFISGLIGLLFRELIFTISAAILASLLVAITLVPSLAARMSSESRGRAHEIVARVIESLQARYAGWVTRVLARPGLVIGTAFLLLAVIGLPTFLTSKQDFLPNMDDGRINVNVTTDPGVSLEAMDASVRTLERIAYEQASVESVYTLVGGAIFGRTERETPNRSSLSVQLVPLEARSVSSEEWVKHYQRAVEKAQLAGMKVRARTAGIRGIRTSRAEEDISLRVQGPDLDRLTAIGEDLVRRLQGLPGVRNLRHSLEESRQEFAIETDRSRAAELGIDVADVGRALRVALDGVIIGDYLEGERAYDIRVRLPQTEIDNPEALGRILLFGELRDRPAVYLRDVASIGIVQAPSEIMRDRQARIVEVSAALTKERPLGLVVEEIHRRLEGYAMPPGYRLYSGGAEEALEKGRRLTSVLLGLALFLVFVVMAVLYESLRNPTVIMLSVPFALIGVTAALWLTGLPLSMPVWLGLIMLAGIVVNNAIVLVEYIEQRRAMGEPVKEAIVNAARLRLRPILMTTLTTVIGMTPLALGLGAGSEMLQPLAVTVVAGLSFSLVVSLVLVPAMYLVLRGRGPITAPPEQTGEPVRL